MDDSNKSGLGKTDSNRKSAANRRGHSRSSIRVIRSENTKPIVKKEPGGSTANKSTGSDIKPLGKRKAPRFRDMRRAPKKGIKQLIPLKRREKSAFDNNDDSLKIIPLGGLGEVGRNMCVFEYKDEIIIVDAGFGFPESDQPGIDYNLPNIDYLKDKVDMIQGIIITHGHYDHIGALPYIVDKLDNPTIYTTALSAGIIKKRHSEFPQLAELDITNVSDKNVIKLGKHFTIEFVHVNHNIPEDLALYITTPAGTVFHTGDWKFDPEPYREKPTDIAHIKQLGDRGITLLMSDSTGAERAGSSISETEISRNLEKIFEKAQGRIIAATFASLINRVQQMITLSEKYGRKVIIDGYSMKSNIEIMKELGEIQINKGTQIPMEQIDDYPDNKITVIGTGAQGEERAVLMRIASGEHRFVRLRNTDTAIFSSSVIPGNERTVQRVQDLLYRAGVSVFHYQMMDIHSGGHALQDDLRKMIGYTRPQYFLPVHGYYSMMVNHANLAKEEGVPKENVMIPDNGNIIHITKKDWWYDKQTAMVDNIMVDGLGVGDVGNVVIRDRQVLAEEGMFVVVVLVGRNGTVHGSPDIISRGFVYLKDNKELLSEVRKKIKETVKKIATRPLNTTDIKNGIREQIGLFLFKKTERRPMILPVVIEL